MSSKDLVESSCDYEVSNHCILTVTIPEFSSFKEHGESRFSNYKTCDDDFKKYFSPAFFANGDCKENEGYVSILLNENGLEYLGFVVQLEINCTVSVIDTAGYKRFQQTFVYIFDGKAHPGLENDVPKLGLDRYLKRETLCNDSSELLPGDCLNVHIEVNYLIRYVAEPQEIFSESVVRVGRKYFMRLDSSFGRKLCKTCEYFQRASDTPMIENKTRRVYIPHNELEAFLAITSILLKAKGIKITSVASLCQLYAVADKYDIPTVIERSRQLLKGFLCKINDSKIFQHTVESTPMISELAERYNDESLKEMVALYLEIKEKYETNESAFEEQVKRKLETDWRCECLEMSEGFYLWLPQKRGNDKEPEMAYYI